MEETDIRTPLEREVSEHPAAEALDLLKLIYQNEFGCGHLICDPKENLRRLLAEVEELPKDQGEVRVQPIGNGLCRLPLSLLHRSGLRAETVQKLFLLTAEQPRGSREGFLQKVSELQVWLEDRDGPVRPEEVSAALRRWQLEGESPFRHSAGYRRLYAPAYRVLEERYCAFLPLFGAIDARLRRGGALPGSNRRKLRRWKVHAGGPFESGIWMPGDPYGPLFPAAGPADSGAVGRTRRKCGL